MILPACHSLLASFRCFGFCFYRGSPCFYSTKNVQRPLPFFSTLTPIKHSLGRIYFPDASLVPSPTPIPYKCVHPFHFVAWSTSLCVGFSFAFALSDSSPCLCGTARHTYQRFLSGCRQFSSTLAPPSSTLSLGLRGPGSCRQVEFSNFRKSHASVESYSVFFLLRPCKSALPLLRKIDLGSTCLSAIRGKVFPIVALEYFPN